jgi:myosin-15
LINGCNEHLHGLTHRCLFKLEQQEYEREKLDWTPISIEDNTPVINLLVKKPVGILHLLDDESNFPKGTDLSFLEKCHYNHALDENYLRSRVSQNEFGIRHFAGNVWYSVEGFIEKNRDFVRADVKYLLQNSKDKLIGKILSQSHHQYSGNMRHHGNAAAGNQSGGPRFVTMKPRAPTVSARFTDNLNSLLESVTKCNPWFVRCIKPNNQKRAGVFDHDTVLEQIRYGFFYMATECFFFISMATDSVFLHLHRQCLIFHGN